MANYAEKLAKLAEEEKFLTNFDDQSYRPKHVRTDYSNVDMKMFRGCLLAWTSGQAKGEWKEFGHETGSSTSVRKHDFDRCPQVWSMTTRHRQLKDTPYDHNLDPAAIHNSRNLPLISGRFAITLWISMHLHACEKLTITKGVNRRSVKMRTSSPLILVPQSYEDQ